MAAIDVFNARYNSGETLLNRIEAIVAQVAQYIFIEDPATEHHDDRMKWAKHVLINNKTRTMAETMAWAVVANATISQKIEAGGESNVPDGDIEYVISSSAYIWGSTL